MSRYLACLCLLPVAAQAETYVVLPESEIVVTASRSARPLAETAQSVTVIDAAEIAARQSPVVVDLLRTVPGVSFSRNGGPGTVTGVNIRGAEADQTVVLIDGVKLNDPSTPGGGFDFGNLLTGNIDRIEVVRGSQSVIWGSQAIGGVVNLLTRAPGEALRLDARAEGGSFGTAQGVANISGRFGAVAASAGGTYFTTDGFSAADAGSEDDGYRNYGGNARVEVTLNDAVSLDLRGYVSDGRADIDGFSFSPPFGLIDTGQTSETQEIVGYAGLNAALFDGALRNRFGFAYTRTKRGNFEADGFQTFDANGRNERFEYQGIAEIGDGVGAVFGVESEKSRYRTEGFGSISTADARLTSGYGELRVRPFEGATLTGGVRHDDHDRFGGATTLAASGVFSPNGGATRLRASFGEGFKVPSLFQLYSDFGNRGLAPERSTSFDAGVAQSFAGGRADVSATYFRRTTRDQIDFVSCFASSAPFCVDRPFGTYDNIRRARSQGVEAVVTVRPADGFTVAANYSFIDTENRDTGRELARRPRHTASLVADYLWSFGLATGATVAMVGDRFDDAANARRVDGHVLVDVRASFEVTKGVEIYGRVENLFDESYQTVFQYGTAGRAAYAGVRLTL